MLSKQEKGFVKAKEDYKDFIEEAKTLKTYRDRIWVYFKDAEPILPRFGSYEGKLVKYKVIDDDITAVMYLNKRFQVMYEIIPTIVFKNFLEKEGHNSFFKIKYELFGFDKDWHFDIKTKYYPGDGKPEWYDNQWFRDLAEQVIDDPEEKKEVLALADERHQRTR